MKASIALMDKSNYYKGLLILVGKDRIVHQEERLLMLKLGEILDFDKRFCQAAIDNLLHNKYLIDEPIIFSNGNIAMSFLLDAIRLAFIDGEIHPHELDWLNAIAQANSVEKEWLDSEVLRFKETKGSLKPPALFHIQQHLQ